MIPKSGWRPVASAPTDGTIVMARSRQWNNPNAAYQVQPAQWLCDPEGKNWTWRKPGAQGTTVYMDDWMSFEDLQKQQDAEMQPKMNLSDEVEFDL